MLRGKELTGRLVAFSKPTLKQDVLFDPTERVRDLLPMLKRLAGADVAVTLNASLAQPMAPIAIRADPAQFDQVMLNLTANARDAMPDGGRLTVGALVVDGRDARVQAAELPDGTYLALRVADTGPGIPESVQDRIFEPFFTTKAEGQGTGLGLATAFAFVQSCGGTIAVESVAGNGATFFIHLPLARPDAPRRPSNPGH